jgi:hypothetical protein
MKVVDMRLTDNSAKNDNRMQNELCNLRSKVYGTNSLQASYRLQDT